MAADVMEGESRKNTRLNIYTDEEALQVNTTANIHYLPFLV